MPHKPALLLVEDDPLYVLDLEDMLLDAGFTVFAALNGDAAIAEISSAPEKFTCLVTDITLGTATDGWAVARHARAMNPEIAVIYITGGTADAAAHKVPNSTVLTKPFDIAVLTAMIARTAKIELPPVG